MQTFKTMTAAICLLSLAFSALGGALCVQKYAQAFKTVFVGIAVLVILKPIALGQISFSDIFEVGDSAYLAQFNADEVINEAVRLQAKQNIEICACQILSDYEIEYEDLCFDVNIDSFGGISISNISLKSDSPLTAQYALKKLFGDNAEIEVSEID